ncbi:MAG: tRNA preQ1(34) S-adenosylmethionine ribosyltransferase-isomerase QueA [Epsilonproteobacteria bacterium]|nr:tRNA preQ1(34) S-adenosylmethionine ribosyltransferase-isomerase QueA [Campylobacterota bacterium]
MHHKLDPLQVDSYDYELPESLIASAPANPKDSAKLLVYDREKDTITHTIFNQITHFIPKNSAIVFNDTKVIKARLYGHKESGGKVELLINSPLPDNHFLVYIRGKVKVGTKLSFTKNLTAIVTALHKDGTRVVLFYQEDMLLDFVALNDILEKIGHIPLPPYIKREDNKEDQTDYQTLFAKNIGAVAAPTASLHFTPPLLERIQEEYHNTFITLHVGAGTFKPVEHNEINAHIMHKEFFEIPYDTKQLLETNTPILAVGTTVTRTVEYYARHKISSGESDLFLHPHNKPQRVNHLLTNFHLPKSTLIMLVASFVGLEKTLELYQIAIENKYQFYSYGDAMLII